MSDPEATTWRELAATLDAHRRAGRRIVTTNGCFDGLHAGHLSFLERARGLGDVLVVGINSDASVSRLKGPDRPRMPASDRVRLLRALRPVDHVVVFDDDLPLGFLDAVRPHLHVKGGDYDPERMPETRLVRQNGGEVRVLPLVEGKSSTLTYMPEAALAASDPRARTILLECLRWSNLVRQTGYALSGRILEAALLLHQTLDSGGKILVAGNGGSACDADHFAAEIIGRFRRVRDGAAVVSLVQGAGVLTSLGNDFGFGDIFRRQLIALGQPQDSFLAISTSGKSENILRALTEARSRQIKTILLTGKSGGPARALADLVLDVPSDDTVDIQQGHRAVIHAICEQIDALLSPEVSP
ncbi:MAG: SIS domain-containing protein [Myxococcota bacterium]